MGQPYSRDVTIIGQSPHFGKVLLYEDFEHILQWENQAFGSVGRATLVPGKCLTGNYALRLKTPGAVDCGAIRRVWLPYARRVKLEFHFLFTVVSDINYFDIYLAYYDGTYQHRLEVLYSRAEEKWKYYDITGTLSDIPEGSQKFKDDAWNRFTWVVNYRDGYHELLEVNNMKIDMSGLEYPRVSNTTAPHLEIVLYTVGATTTGSDIYIDSVFLSIE